MISQAPINLLRECPMDVLIWSLFPVSEILHRARFLSYKCVFSFTTLLSVLRWQGSTKRKCREDSTFLTLFSCEHPVIPGEMLVQQKKKWSRKALFHCSNPSLFGVLPFAWVPPSVPRSAPTPITSPHQLCNAKYHSPTWRTWPYAMITQAVQKALFTYQDKGSHGSMEVTIAHSLSGWLFQLNQSLSSLTSNLA